MGGGTGWEGVRKVAEKRSQVAEKRSQGAEKRSQGAEKRSCTLGPPYICTICWGGGGGGGIGLLCNV